MMLLLRHVGLATEADALLDCLLDISIHEGKGRSPGALWGEIILALGNPRRVALASYLPVF